MLKRNKSIFRGQKVSYYEHTSGVINTRKPLIKSAIIPVFTLACLIGIGGFFSYQSIFNKPVQVAQNATALSEVKKPNKPEIITEQKTVKPYEDKNLTTNVRSVIARNGGLGEYSVVVRDLKSGRSVNIESSQKMPAGELYKLFLLPSLEKKTDSSEWNKWLNGKSNIGDCVKEMIKSSENRCGEAITKYVDAKTLDSYNKNLGFNSTHTEDITKSTTSASDVSEIIYRLQSSQLLSDKGRRTFFDGFYEQKIRKGIPIGCGSECLVGNKTSEQADYKYDAAVVTSGNSKYVLVIMSKGSNWQLIGDIAKGIDYHMKHIND